jgi:hypothetical protein
MLLLSQKTAQIFLSASGNFNHVLLPRPYAANNGVFGIDIKDFLDEKAMASVSCRMRRCIRSERTNRAQARRPTDPIVLVVG